MKWILNLWSKLNSWYCRFMFGVEASGRWRVEWNNELGLFIAEKDDCRIVNESISILEQQMDLIDAMDERWDSQ